MYIHLYRYTSGKIFTTSSSTPHSIFKSVHPTCITWLHIYMAVSSVVSSSFPRRLGKTTPTQMLPHGCRF